MFLSRRGMMKLVVADVALLFMTRASFAQEESAESGEEATPYSPEELEEIVGSIALYPDTLLGHILPASTLPEEIDTALERLEANGGEPDDSDPELLALDENIQALLAFPEVLEMMQEFSDWRAELAYAMLVQESEVLEAIQSFRAKAYDTGNLESSEYITVEVEGPTIIVEQASPDVVYVPVYEPAEVVVRHDYPILTFAAAVLVVDFIFDNTHWGWGHPYYHSGYFGGPHGGRWHPPPHGRPPHRPPPRPPGRPPQPRPRPPGGGAGGPGGPPRSGQGPSRGPSPSGQRPPAQRPSPTSTRPASTPSPSSTRAASAPRPSSTASRPTSAQRPSSTRPTSTQRPSSSRSTSAARPSSGSRPGTGSSHQGGALRAPSSSGRSSRSASSRGASSRGGGRGR